MENGLHYMAVAFAMQLVKLLLVDERSVSHITEADLFHTIETLMRTCAHSRANAPEGLECTHLYLKLTDKPLSLYYAVFPSE